MSIEVLGIVGGIRHRPEMYIGDADTPNQLVHEVLDNALDELVNKFATTINVEITDDDIVIVKDDGRGIPHFTEVEGKREYAPVVICTYLHSSGKTGKNVRKLYDIHIGRHGVGMTVVNALSEFLEITTTNRGYTLFVRFEDAKLVKCERRKAKEDEKGTIVCFKPLKEQFKNGIDKDEIVNRLKLIVATTDSTILYNKHQIKVDQETFVRELIACENELLHVTAKDGHEYVDFYFTWDDPSSNVTPEIKTAINLKLCDSKIQAQLVRLVGQACQVLKIVDANKSVYRLRGFASVFLKEPVFDSQHKTRCISSLSTTLQEKLVKAIESKVKTSDFVKESLELTQLMTIRKQIKRSNTVRRTRLSIDYFKDCEQHPGKVLYIVEGKSAEGTLLDVRNPKTEAIFPLKGKVLNVVEHPLSRITTSQTVLDLLKVIGYDFKSLKPNFEKYVICADPDPDGSHISALVLMIFYKLTPQLIKEGRVSILQVPLWGLVNTKRKEFIPCKERPSTKNGYQVMRFKGLGEFEAWQFEHLIRNESYYYYPPYEQIDVKSLLTNKKRLLQDIIAE